MTQIGFLLRCAVGCVLSGFLILLVPAEGETQQERNPIYTIAFTSLAPWDLDVFLAHADGSEPAPLLSHPALDYNAAFSPDGKSIVFTSHRDGNADLYRVRLDGSGLERLTDHPAFDDAAALSPDSQRIAFVSSRSGQADIWVRDLEHRKTWNVTDASGGDFRPAWSPDGQWLAFSSNRGMWRESDIYIIRPDGSGLRRLTDTPGWDGSPSWSPDGKRLAYYSSAGGSRQISVLDVFPPAPPGRLPGPSLRNDASKQTHSPRQITESPGSKLSPHWRTDQRVCFTWAGDEGSLGCVSLEGTETRLARFPIQGEFHSPSWSPDGTSVVFHRRTTRPTPAVREQGSRASGFRLLRINGSFPSFGPKGDTLSFTQDFRTIARMRIDGSDRLEVFSPAFAPAWSPQGNTIAFTRGRVFAGSNTDNEIYLTAPDGSQVRNVTQHPANDALPSWSPDSQRLVFRSTRDGNKELYIIGKDGAGLTRLTSSPGTDTFPHWSPGGNRIVFTSNRSSDFEIYTIRSDGSDLRQLTHSPGLDMHPLWSPDGQWICFASARGGFKDEQPLTGNPQPYGDLYLMRPDGSAVQPLTDDQFEDGTPGWAPLP